MSALMKAMPPMQWLGMGINLAATLTAAWYGFSFGYQVGGAFIGVVAAVNVGVMASLLTCALLDFCLRRRG
jgi:ABC-type transporter Mla maintaining outer membrane lipid asymmetry permease subunit MlaE